MSKTSDLHIEEVDRAGCEFRTGRIGEAAFRERMGGLGFTWLEIQDRVAELRAPDETKKVALEIVAMHARREIDDEELRRRFKNLGFQAIDDKGAIAVKPSGKHLAFYNDLMASANAVMAKRAGELTNGEIIALFGRLLGDVVVNTTCNDERCGCRAEGAKLAMKNMAQAMADDETGLERAVAPTETRH